MPALLSLVYSVSYLLALVCLVFTPLPKGLSNVISRIALAFFTLMSLDALCAGFLSVAHFPSNLFSSTIFHLLVAIAVIYLIITKKKIQKLHVDAIDIVALLTLGITALMCGYGEFGPDLAIRWLASDAAVHLDSIRGIVETDTVHGMYVAWNFMAPWVEIASTFLGSTEVYKALIIGDIVILFFGGLLFYALLITTVSCASAKQRLAFVAVSVLYLFGYPLNSMLLGFFYLNVGVFMAISSVIFCTQLIEEVTIANIIGITMSLYGLINSYALFAPTIYLLLFVVLVWNWKNRQLISKGRAIGALAFVFVFTGAAGIYFTYFGTFPTTGTVTAISAIARGGGIYGNLYSNQLLLAPFVLVTIISCRHKILRKPVIVTLLGILTTILILFCLTFSRTVSTYYFFKLYYLLSPFMFACAVYGVLYSLKQGAGILLASCSITIGIVGAIMLGGIDQKLAAYAPDRDYGVVSSYHPVLDIYSYNYITLRYATPFDSAALELFKNADELIGSSDRPIALLGNIEQYYWWVALVRQNEAKRDYPIELRPWSTDSPREAYNNIENTCDYVVVLTREPIASVGSEESREVATMLSDRNHQVVFSNDAGYILKIERG